MSRNLNKILFLILLVSINASAQPKYKADLPALRATGFYKILLSPRVVGASQHDLADLRLNDGNGKQVPYIVKTASPFVEENNLQNLPIVNAGREADKQTHITISNSSKKYIDHLLLFVKNTEANRQVSLSGSEDNKNWFIIKENILLENYYSGKEEFVQNLVFPKSNYAFFRITIIGKELLPINITHVATSTSRLAEGRYIALPPPVISQIDSSDNNSYIQAVLDGQYNIDRVDVNVSGSRFFRRSIAISAGSSPATFYVLNSASAGSFPVKLKASRLTLRIENGDNPALQVGSVAAWQLDRYLLAYLEKEQDYTIYFGDSLAKPPVYDLAYFRDSLSADLPVLSVGRMEKVDEKVTGAKAAASKPYLLWAIIIGVLLLLFVVTMRLTREVGKRES